jgi:hypothetical protein
MSSAVPGDEDWLTDHAVQAGVTLWQRQQNDAQAAAYDQAVKQLVQGAPGATALDVAPDILSQVSPDQWQVLNRIVQSRASGTIIGPTPDNQRLFTGLLGEASTDPQSFVARDLHASFDQLPTVQYQRLLALKNAITNGDPAEQHRQIALAGGLGVAANDIATAGLSDQPGPDGAPSESAVFAGQVAQLLDAWQDNNPGKTAHAGDVRDMTRQALSWRGSAVGVTLDADSPIQSQSLPPPNIPGSNIPDQGVPEDYSPHSKWGDENRPETGLHGEPTIPNNIVPPNSVDPGMPQPDQPFTPDVGSRDRTYSI